MELQKVKLYTVDLTRADTEGEVKCPKCGVEISPDDLTEENYEILETIMKGDSLEKIVVRCNKCRSQIHLVGLEILDHE